MELHRLGNYIIQGVFMNFNKMKVFFTLITMFLIVSCFNFVLAENSQDKEMETSFLPVDNTVTGDVPSTSTSAVVYDSSTAPRDYQPVNSINKLNLSSKVRVMANDANRVLLIQEVLPWKSDANRSVLESLNISCTTISMRQFADTDLRGYYLVIVANDQNLGFYNDYDTVKAKLEKYVSGGGILVMGACDSGWANGIMTSGLPGGVELAPVYYDPRNVVADPSHPIVTGEMTNSQVLTDADLYSNYCSHREFNESTLPAESRVVLRSSASKNPTLVEYPLGKGKIIASGLTWEHNWYYHTGSDGYGAFARKSLDDLYAYAASMTNPAAGYEFRRQVGIEYEQTSQPLQDISLPSIENIDIEVIDEIAGRYQLTISRYSVDTNSGAEPFFFWKTSDGYFGDSNEDFTSVEFNANPGTYGQQLEITAYIGDNLGYIDSKSVTVSGTQVQNEEGLEVTLTSQPNNLSGWEDYEIRYSAVLYYGGKVVPGTSADIYYSLDGVNWETIVTGLVNTNSYIWNVPNDNVSGAKIRIVAQNGSYKTFVESSEFNIQPTFYIEGKVLDKSGNGVSDVKVSVSNSYAATDKTGYYVVKVEGSGSYQLKAESSGSSFVKNEFTVLLDNDSFHEYKVFRVK